MISRFSFTIDKEIFTGELHVVTILYYFQDRSALLLLTVFLFFLFPCFMDCMSMCFQLNDTNILHGNLDKNYLS